MFIAAGAFAWRALRPSGSTLGGTTTTLPSDGTIVATFRVVKGQEGGSSPFATLSTPTEKIDGTATSFSWTTSQSVMNADTAAPDFVNTDFIPVIVGSSLVIDSDATGVTGSLESQGPYPFAQVQSFGQISDPVRLDQPPGRYILHLVPAWDQGTVNYYFPIDLVAPGPTSTSGPDAVLSFVGGNAPQGSLTWGGTERDGVRGDYTWCQASGTCVSGFPDFASYPPVDPFLPIPPGTSLRLEGDAIGLEGILKTSEGATVSKLTLDESGDVPTTPGRYVLELHVNLTGSDGGHGRAVFFFGIESTSTEPSVSPPGNELAGTDWRLVSIGGTPIPAGAEPIGVGFAEDRMGFIVGCRGFWGPYRVRNTSIKVGDLVGIMPLCQGEGKDDLDRAHAASVALAQATTFDVTGNRLTITSSTTSLVFEATASP